MAALKGTAIIELAEADGSKKTYKHDNMITNAPADLCKSNRGEMATILKMMSNGDSYAKTLFGGILLFNDTLNTDAGDYFLPSGKITGYASQSAYTGLDTARGSMNEAESGLQEDGSYKFVWDFSTSQGNGVIKSLALCPNIMGEIGATETVVSSERKSFTNINSQTAPFDSNGEMLNNNSVLDGLATPYYLFLIAELDGVGYAVWTDNLESYNGNNHILKNGGILYIYRFSLGVDKVTLTDKAGQATYIDRVDVQLPTDFTADLYSPGYNTQYSSLAFSFLPEVGKVIVYPCCKKASIAVNGTCKFLEIDLKNNMAISQYSFTNTTAGTIPSAGDLSVNSGYSATAVFKDYIVVAADVTGGRKLYAIKRSDNTQVKELKYPSGKEALLATDFVFYPSFWTDTMAVIGLGNQNYASDYCHYILDLVNGIILDTNAKGLTECNNIQTLSKAAYIKTGPYTAYSTIPNPFVLTTKNNLDSPVTKTASQTMKITYTLSVADTAGSEV